MREFVGADRGVRRLAVTPIREELLVPGSPGAEPTVSIDASLYDALSAMLVAGADRVLVADSDGTPLGHLTRDSILDTRVATG